MKPIRLRSLLAAAVVAALTATTQAQTLRVRSHVEVDPALAAALEQGTERLRVLIVARETSASMNVMGDQSPTARRRAMAEASTAEILSIVQEGTDGPGILAEAPRATNLWAANTIATEVDVATLEKLQAAGSVQRILLDRVVQVLTFDEGAEGEEAPPEEPINYGVAKIRADEARTTHSLTGEGVRVGLIDTGTDGEHPALAGRVERFKDFVNGQNEKAYDDQGHGTHCAGTIAGSGKIGIAPGASLVVAKAMNAQGGGSLSGLLEAMQWMLDPDGDPSTDDQPALVSNSWGADADALGDSRELFRDVVKAWREAGIVPVFASGNSGPDTRAVPGGYPESFAVGATDSGDASADFSTGGEIEFDGETFLKPDVSAPGVHIVSSLPGGKYRALNGTSMACPHVAGALALAFQAHPQTPVAEMEAAFIAGSVDLGDEGRDARFGEGRIDVMGALEALAGKGNAD